MAEFVELDGHMVDPEKMDRFWNGDGTRTSDEQWDEDKRRAIAGLAGEIIVPLDIQTEPPVGCTDEPFVWDGENSG